MRKYRKVFKGRSRRLGLWQREKKGEKRINLSIGQAERD